MSTSSQVDTSRGTAARLLACCRWLIVFGFLAVLVYIAVDAWCVRRMERSDVRNRPQADDCSDGSTQTWRDSLLVPA